MHLRYECKTDANRAKVPLLVNKLEGLQESEDEGIAEPRKKREPKHNGLGDEHVERSGFLLV